jgi:hypothetical protein
MSVGTTIDAFLDRAQKAGPYAVSLGLAALGLGIYRAAGVEPIGGPATIMSWTGSLMCALSLILLVLWHFLKWPSWFGPSD